MVWIGGLQGWRGVCGGGGVGLWLGGSAVVVGQNGGRSCSRVCVDTTIGGVDGRRSIRECVVRLRGGRFHVGGRDGVFHLVILVVFVGALFVFADVAEGRGWGRFGGY